MAKKKRSSRSSGLVNRAVRAGRRAFKEAESRVPPDLRRQLERRLKDADKTARAAIKTLQTQVRRASTRGDVNNVLKRIDGLTKQARQIAFGGSGATAPRRRAASPTRKSTSRSRKAATTRRKPAARSAAPAKATSARRTSAKRASTPRRTRAYRTTAPEAAPMAEVAEVEIVEIVEP
ncbi:MAG TPA: hypothetical protein VEN12_05395 [Verrucomicrobiae bacterium]|nr:hypothetical protein [Verrucomicrobiae bacterium]